MSIVAVFAFLTTYLNFLMLGSLVIALGLRFLAYRSGRSNEFYFKTFVQNVEKQIDVEKGRAKIDNVDDWMDGFLDKVMLDMPNRNIRLQDGDQGGPKSRGMKLEHQESMEEFAHGKRSIIHAIKQQIDAFKSSHPPSFSEMASRVLSKDRKSTIVLRVVPVDLLSRVLDVLPGLFVVGGIFGTFIGITNALPRIASIDLAQLDQAGSVMSAFVADIAFSMNTSIVGIICSVLMTVLNALFPLGNIRRSVLKHVEQSLEMLWVRIHGGKIEAGDVRMIELLEKIHQELSSSKGQPFKKAA